MCVEFALDEHHGMHMCVVVACMAMTIKPVNEWFKIELGEALSTPGMRAREVVTVHRSSRGARYGSLDLTRSSVMMHSSTAWSKNVTCR